MNYTILPINEINQEMIDTCVEWSIETVRKSLDGLEGILKYTGEIPSVLIGYPKYSQEEILEIIHGNNNNWNLEE